MEQVGQLEEIYALASLRYIKWYSEFTTAALAALGEIYNQLK
jgi:hypothetical protein